MYNKRSETVLIEMDLKKLESLFNQGDLCALDLRCLNAKSKQLVQSLCLTSCAKSLRADTDCVGCYRAVFTPSRGSFKGLFHK